MICPAGFLGSFSTRAMICNANFFVLEGVWEVACVIKEGHETQTLPHRHDRCTMGADCFPHSAAQARGPRAQDRHARTDQCLALLAARRGLLALAPARLPPVWHRLVVLLRLA